MTMRWPWSPPPPKQEPIPPDPVVVEARTERERIAAWLARIMPNIDPNDLTEPAGTPIAQGAPHGAD